MYKIIGADGKEYGPISAEQLRQWMVEGRANQQTKVLPEGATEWKTVGELPEFSGTPTKTVPVISGPTPTSAGAAEMVNGPAIGLIATAVLGLLAQVLSLIANLAGASVLAGLHMPKEAMSNMFSGAVGIVGGIIGIAVGLVILVGAMKMKKLENYGFAMAASIIAMIPCFSPCCLLGLPIGIWALVVLSKPEVKSAFH
jgi:hypothetical protein